MSRSSRPSRTSAGTKMSPTRSSIPTGRSRSCRCWPARTDGRARRSSGRCTAGDAPAMLDLPERALAHEIEKRMGGFLGPVALAGPRWNYPLGFHHAAPITDLRLALAGDAAHGIHPIAGQGLNLGFRDAAALTEVLVEGARLGLDLGDAQLLARYERWRSLDTLMVAARHRRPDPALRRSGPRRLGDPPLRHGRGPADRAAEGPADGRGARRKRRPAAAAARACRSRSRSLDLGWTRSLVRFDSSLPSPDVPRIIRNVPDQLPGIVHSPSISSPPGWIDAVIVRRRPARDRRRS